MRRTTLTRSGAFLFHLLHLKGINLGPSSFGASLEPHPPSAYFLSLPISLHIFLPPATPWHIHSCIVILNMAGNNDRRPRKAATEARSSIAASLRQQSATYDDSDQIILKPARKIARTSVTSKQDQHSISDKSSDWYFAIDFGTTFTAVACHRTGTPLERIYTINNFPGETLLDRVRTQIPSEL